jgi:hypothetical protein
MAAAKALLCFLGLTLVRVLCSRRTLSVEAGAHHGVLRRRRADRPGRRIMSAKLTELLGQTFVVENKTGAGGNLGAADVAKAAPDGYTLLMATVSTHAINRALQEHALRPGARLRAGRPGRSDALRAGGESVAPGERREGLIAL